MGQYSLEEIVDAAKIVCEQLGQIGEYAHEYLDGKISLMYSPTSVSLRIKDPKIYASTILVLSISKKFECISDTPNKWDVSIHRRGLWEKYLIEILAEKAKKSFKETGVEKRFSDIEDSEVFEGFFKKENK